MWWVLPTNNIICFIVSRSVEQLSILELTPSENCLSAVAVAMSEYICCSILTWIIFWLWMPSNPFIAEALLPNMIVQLVSSRDQHDLTAALLAANCKLTGKNMTYAEHEWLPSVAGSLHPLEQSLGWPTSPGFLQWNSTFLMSSFSRSDPFKTSFRSSSVNPIISSISLVQRYVTGNRLVTFVFNQDIRAIIKARSACLRCETSCGQCKDCKENRRKLHCEANEIFKI